MSVIEISGTRRIFPDLHEAWRCRHLGLMLAKRNIKVRYMQTLLGSIWVVAQPLLLTGMLTLILGMLLSVPSDGMSYALFVFAGTTAWSTFQRALSDISVSLAASGNIILKVYFPRILIPLSSAITALIDVVPIYVVLLVTVVAFGNFPARQRCYRRSSCCSRSSWRLRSASGSPCSTRSFATCVWWCRRPCN